MTKTDKTPSKLDKDMPDIIRPGENAPEKAMANTQEFQMPVIEQDSHVPAAIQQADRMIELAVSKDLDMDKLQKLYEMKKDAEAEEAKRAFAAAKSAFMGEEIVVDKDRKVSFQNNDGSLTEYSHASLGNYIEKISSALSRCGLSVNWEMKQEDGKISGRCILTHAMGHSEKSGWMHLAADSSGKKNAIQQVASTRSYIKRYTLEEVVGVASKDADGDDDGVAAGFASPVELISEEQSLQIHAKITDNEFPMQIFMDWLTSAFVGVAKIDDIPAEYFDKVMHKLEVSIKARKANG